MSRNVKHIVPCFVAILILLGLQACKQKTPTDWNVTLNKEDKNPYGAYLAYESLKYYFPNSKISALSRSYRFNRMDDKMKYHYNDSVSLVIFTGLDFIVSNKEAEELVDFAAKGNEVIIFCSYLDSKLANKFNCKKYGDGYSPYGGRYEEYSMDYFDPNDSNKNFVTIGSDTTHYGMRGRTLLSELTITDSRTPEQMENASDSLSDFIERDEVPVEDETDTAYTQTAEILGYHDAKPNFVRYRVGGGHISFHVAPLAMSNYFLLQKNNRDYLTSVWQTLPKNISTIYWDSYYKRRIEAAGMKTLLKYPAVKWALWVALAVILMYVLFEGKRRQRIVPIIKKLDNSSVSFVETVGRLYYNKGNHANLAEKMSQHFLEWVRTHYYLNTNELGEAFIKQLTIKSGLAESVVKEMVNMIHEIRLRSATIDEPYVFHLYQTIQQFYKNHKH